jgi:2',3'-cyclic-nucleotide 2'-phosphodiesterase (5'-nucleotidase family)
MHLRFFVFLTILLTSCATHHLKDIEEVSVELTPSYRGPANVVDTIVAPYQQQLGTAMEDTIGTLSDKLTKNRPDYSLGYWFADVIRIQTQNYLGQEIDIGIMNQGGIRVPYLEAGPILKRHMYELMPFDNMLVAMPLDGTTLLQLVAHMAQQGGWPVSEELSYEIVDGTSKAISYQGQPIDPQKTYLVAMSDYMANGGDNCDFLKNLPRLETGRFMRDGLIEYITNQTAKGKAIRFEPEERIKWVNE